MPNADLLEIPSFSQSYIPQLKFTIYPQILRIWQNSRQSISIMKYRGGE
jgi:hypothetical protein